MSYIYDLFISPIEMIVDLVFQFFWTEISAGGIAIVGVSLVINFLTLPLYNVADKIQQNERDLQKKLEPRVKKIKSAFSGDEQFLILSEYYRQNNYHPLYSLRNALSIIIQIPFFMAAYNYLSNSTELKDVSFFFLKNLGEPDALFSLKIGTKLLIVNVLPIVMTLINVISGIIYSKGYPIKEKIQIYGLAAIFLVILYNSPSGLVFYWILNNLFSLGKNIVLKMKNPKKVVYIGVSVALVAFSLFMWITRPSATFSKKLLLSFFALFVVVLPLIINCGKKIISKTNLSRNIGEINHQEKKNYFLLMLFSGLALAFAIGFTVPSSVIATSPIEFSYLGETANPIAYILHSLFFMLGLCVFYPLLFYKVFNINPKILGWSLFTLAICAITNIYVFKHDYGTFNTQFVLENSGILEKTSLVNTVFPILLLLMLFVLIFLCERKFRTLVKYISFFLLAIVIGEIGLSVYKISTIQSEFNRYTELRASYEDDKDEEITPVFNLTKTGKNVIVLFIDRGISEYFPYALEEFPELNEYYKGFVYYPNCLSYGFLTYPGAPAMLGGYDYTPAKMNERSDTLLVDKHNESLMLMPKLFSDAGYDVVVTDTPWTNYSWTPDFTPFNKFPEIKTKAIQRMYLSEYYKKVNLSESIGLLLDKGCKNRLPYFSLLQSLLPSLRIHFYTLSSYSYLVSNSAFTDSFSALYLLPDFTSFDNDKNTYSFIGNDSPHEWSYMNVPEYTQEVNKKVQIINSSYEFIDDQQLKAYQVNMATFKTIGNYLKYLQENDCYDNTRIIIVSDHGNGSLDLKSFDSDIEDLGSAYNATLLVKDFYSNSEIKTDYKLSTNADTLLYVTDGLNLSEENPFTKKKMTKTRENENEIELRILGENLTWDARMYIKRNQFTFEDKTYIIKDNIFEAENWTLKED